MKQHLLKRTLCCLLALLALLPAIALPVRSASAETALATGYVSASKLNMRPDPSTRQAISATLKRGDVVNVYEICGVWLRIDVPTLGKSGYVSGKYITLNSSTGFYGLGMTAGTVHVRSKNTAESESKGVVPGNTGLILQQMESNGWWKVKVSGDGLEGYIAKKFVTVICKAAKSAASGSAETKATISGEGVNLRTGASTKNKSLGLLKKGTAVTVLGSSGAWYQVKVTSSGKTGYVSKAYVKLSSTATPTPKPTSASAYISASNVNLRTSASTASKSLGLLAKNTAVTVLGSSGSWYQVKVTSTGKTGYVYKTYVKLSSAAATPQPAGTPGYINASGVNLRTGPSTATKSQGKLERNTTVSVLTTTGSWCQVKVAANGKTGYVSKTYVTLSGTPTATPAATATAAPTASPTPAPTATPVPTASPTPVPTASPTAAQS